MNVRYESINAPASTTHSPPHQQRPVAPTHLDLGVREQGLQVLDRDVLEDLDQHVRVVAQPRNHDDSPKHLQRARLATHRVPPGAAIALDAAVPADPDFQMLDPLGVQADAQAVRVRGPDRRLDLDIGQTREIRLLQHVGQTTTQFGVSFRRANLLERLQRLGVAIWVEGGVQIGQLARERRRLLLDHVPQRVGDLPKPGGLEPEPLAILGQHRNQLTGPDRHKTVIRPMPFGISGWITAQLAPARGHGPNRTRLAGENVAAGATRTDRCKRGMRLAN
jgi:hypothetical protein